MKQKDLTVVIPTLNEANNIERAIKSAAWADQVWVLDMGSTDRTVDIAQLLGAKVVIRNEGKQFVGVQDNLNWAGKECGTEWVFRLDADEEFTPKLAEEIKDILSRDSEYVAFGVPRKQFFLGDFLKGGDWYYDRLVRLYRPDKVCYANLVSVHEQLVVNGQQSYLKHPLNHYSHPTWKEINHKWNLYTDLEVQRIHESLIIALAKMIFLPGYVWARWMLWHNGWKDGWRGIVVATCRGWYDFLKYGKYIKYRFSSPKKKI